MSSSKPPQSASLDTGIPAAKEPAMAGRARATSDAARFALSDAEQVRAAAAGDVQAYRQLVTNHLAAVVATARRVLHDEAEAEDIAQEAFLRLWRNVGQIEVGALGLRPWLKRVATNLAIDRLRRTKPLATVDEAPEVPVAADQLQNLEKHDVSSRMERALAKLPDRQRQALSLFHFEGMSQIEVGRALGISDEAVESLLARARRTLKADLKDDWQSLIATLSGEDGHD